MRDWFTPQRQSPAAILIILFKNFRAFAGAFAPAMIGIILAGRKTENTGFYIGIALGALGFFSVLLSAINYFIFRFCLEDGQLIIKRTLVSKKKLHIPLERIQAVHFEQNIWNTITGSTRVIIDTPGTDKTEVSIDALSLNDAHAFRKILLSAKEQQPDLNTGKMIENPVMKTKLEDLIKLSLTANHLKSLGLISAFVLARLQDVGEIFKADTWGWLESQSQTLDPGWKLITLLIIFSLIISLIVSIGSTILRYFDFTLIKNQTDLQAKWGLIQIRQIIIPVRKIQMMQWSSNYMRRHLGISILRIKESVNIAEKAAASKKTELKIPLSNSNQLKWVLDCYQQELPSQSTPPAGIHKAYAARRIVLIGFPLVILSCLAFQWISWYCLIPLSLSFYFIVTAIIFRKRFRFWVSDKGLQLHKGVWGEEFSLINWEKIQCVNKSQSIFQRRKNLASIVFHTAGGPVKIPYILNHDADFLMNYALFRTESENKTWM